jgi:hypothetical protein
LSIRRTGHEGSESHRENLEVQPLRIEFLGTTPRPTFVFCPNKRWSSNRCQRKEHCANRPRSQHQTLGVGSFFRQRGVGDSPSTVLTIWKAGNVSGTPNRCNTFSGPLPEGFWKACRITWGECDRRSEWLRSSVTRQGGSYLGSSDSGRLQGTDPGAHRAPFAARSGAEIEPRI